jgi:hypothetical protein
MFKDKGANLVANGKANFFFFNKHDIGIHH